MRFQKNLPFSTLSVVSLVCALLAGCGRDLSGSYSGSQTMPPTSTMALVTPSNVTNNVALALTSGSNNGVSGNWSSPTESGKLSATQTNDGLSNVSLTVAPNSSGTSDLLPLSDCSATYSGNLSATAGGTTTQLTGTLALSTSAANGSMLNCPATRSLTVTKSN